MFCNKLKLAEKSIKNVIKTALKWMKNAFSLIEIREYWKWNKSDQGHISRYFYWDKIAHSEKSKILRYSNSFSPPPPFQKTGKVVENKNF